MKILVACEESQAVTIELRRLGHDAFSCDIIECSGGHPEWHIKDDALRYINGDQCLFWTEDNVGHITPKKWDMIIAFPPCTDLAVSGARYFAEKRADGRQQKVLNSLCNSRRRIVTGSPLKTRSESCRHTSENRIRSFSRGNSDMGKRSRLVCG